VVRRHADDKCQSMVANETLGADIAALRVMSLNLLIGGAEMADLGGAVHHSNKCSLLARCLPRNHVRMHAKLPSR
jgi:hypothetical protein